MLISGKYNFGGGSTLFDSKLGTSNIFIGKVVSITDELGGGLIQVRIKGYDDKISDTDLPQCFPLLQKFINVFPNVGESVFIFLTDDTNKYDSRFYMGPIISQLQNLKNDNHFFSSRSMLSSGVVAPDVNVENLPDAKGIFPKKGDISILGRDNSDIQLKSNEVVIRSGIHLSNNALKFNKINPGYIQVKSNIKIGTDSNKNAINGSVTNIVSNRINLLSHNGNVRFNLTDQDSLITDDELQKILSNTQGILYGNDTITFLKLVINMALNHVHPYSSLPACKDDNYKKLNDFNLTSLLNQNVRIN